MKLEKQLKADASLLLTKMVTEVITNANRVAKAAGLTGDTLCRIAVGTRVESIRKSAIAKIAHKKGEQLYQRYAAENREATK